MVAEHERADVKSLADLDAKQLTFADVRELFRDAWWLETLDWMEEIPVHFVEGGLSIDSIEAGDGPWALIVHGDLHASGDLDFGTSDYKTSLLVVFGSVRARNFCFTNGASCIVEHDVTVSEYVVGRYGDESARLSVGGMLRARAVLLDHVTGLGADEVDAIVCTTEGWSLPIDINYSAENRDVFVPEVLDKADGTLELYLAWKAATRGEPVLLPEAEARLRAARPDIWWRPD